MLSSGKAAWLQNRSQEKLKTAVGKSSRQRFAQLGALLTILMATAAVLETSWACLGAVLERLGIDLGSSKAILGDLQCRGRGRDWGADGETAGLGPPKPKFLNESIKAEPKGQRAMSKNTLTRRRSKRGVS